MVLGFLVLLMVYEIEVRRRIMERICFIYTFRYYLIIFESEYFYKILKFKFNVIIHIQLIITFSNQYETHLICETTIFLLAPSPLNLLFLAFLSFRSSSLESCLVWSISYHTFSKAWPSLTLFSPVSSRPA